MEQGPIQIVQLSQILAWLGDGRAGWVVTGILAGIVVRLMTSSNKSFGLIAACVLGIAGAALGGYGARHFDVALDGPGMRFLAALAGAFALSLAASLVARAVKRP